MKKDLNKKKFIFKTINGITYMSVDIHNEIFDGFVKKLKEKLNRKARKGWEGYIGLVHIEDIRKEIEKRMGEFKDVD